MQNRHRIIVIAILVYLAMGSWWIIAMVRSQSLYETVMGYIYGVPVVLAAAAGAAVFLNWVKLARVLALIAIAPAIPVILAKGETILGFPIPLHLPVTLGASVMGWGFYGVGIEIVPAALFGAAWFFIKPSPPTDAALTP